MSLEEWCQQPAVLDLWFSGLSLILYTYESCLLYMSHVSDICQQPADLDLGITGLDSALLSLPLLYL